MKLRRLSVGVAFVGAVVMSAVVASAANAQTFNPLITVDETGVGTIHFAGESPLPLPGGLAPDPGPGGSSSALTYSLLGPPSLTAGDLLISEDGFLDDVIRFNPANTGGVAGYPASLVFYSNPGHGGFDSLADSPSPPSAFYANTVNADEVGGQVFYHPTEGQPGFVTGFDVAYQIISDVPEPATWAMLILGVAMIGTAARRRSAGIAAA